jgi:glycerol-3-phosphate dehydrogenase (NAD(P)+)
MAKIGILGAGAWGTAIGIGLARRGESVELWAFEEDVAADINQHHRNSRYLIGVDLPTNLSATSDILAAASEKDYLLISIPSPFVIEAVKLILGAQDIIEGRT